MLTDANAWCGTWPFDGQPAVEAAGLRHTLTAAGISAALVAALDGLFAPDPMPAERRLAQQVQGQPGLRHAPVGAADLPNWRAALREAVDTFRAPMVRLVPTLRPAAPDVARLATVAAAAQDLGIRTALVLRTEDERNQHPRLNVAPLPLEAMVGLARRVAPSPLLVLNAYTRELATLAVEHNLWFDTAMLDGDDPIAAAASRCPGRLVFGTAAPLLHAPAQVAKLRATDADPAAAAAVAGLSLADLLAG